MSSRREPLLWLQCLAIGVIPLELLLLRLVLAAADVGPVPGLERVLIWAIGVLVPTFLLWKRPPDWGSLLLVRRPLVGRSALQRQLSAAQGTFPLKLLQAAGALPLLFTVWWIDSSALLVADLSPLSNGSRLGSLLCAGPLLALLLWQWQQLVQSAWLLTREARVIESLSPLNDAALQSSTTSFGLGLLNMPSLDWEPPIKATSSSSTDEVNTTGNPSPAPADADQQPQESSVALGESEESSTEPSISEPTSDDITEMSNEAGEADTIPVVDHSNAAQLTAENSALTGTVEPEQTTEENHSADLDRQISEHDIVAGADTETHHEQTQPPGGEESNPEQPPEASPGGA